VCAETTDSGWFRLTAGNETVVWKLDGAFMYSAPGSYDLWRSAEGEIVFRTNDGSSRAWNAEFTDFLRAETSWTAVEETWNGPGRDTANGAGAGSAGEEGENRYVRVLVKLCFF
jgi:hypothetical protein